MTEREFEAGDWVMFESISGCVREATNIGTVVVVDLRHPCGGHTPWDRMTALADEVKPDLMREMWERFAVVVIEGEDDFVPEDDQCEHVVALALGVPSHWCHDGRFPELRDRWAGRADPDGARTNMARVIRDGLDDLVLLEDGDLRGIDLLALFAATLTGDAVDHGEAIMGHIEAELDRLDLDDWVEIGPPSPRMIAFVESEDFANRLAWAT